MSGVNKVILVGRLGKDPEVRSLNNGSKVVSFSMATSETWKDRDGERQERTEWHNVVIFDEKIGEIAERYLEKGSQAYIEGKMQTRKWTDKDGNDRYTTEVVLQRFSGALQLLGDAPSNGRRRDDDDRGGRGNGNSRGWDNDRSDDRRRGRDEQRGERRSRPADDLDDDIPF